VHPGVSHKQHPPSGAFDAIVVGSGIGGLACAAGLARYGNRRVLVLERHYRIGGYTHTFSRPGYEWDVGVHYIGQVGARGVVGAVFDKLTDGSLKWAPLPDVYDRIVLGDKSYDYVTGSRRFVERMVEYFPRERAGIEAYVKRVRTSARASGPFFMDRALPGALSRVAGALLRRGYLKDALRTTRDVLLELTKDEELIAVLTGQFGDYGLPPGQSSFAIHAAVVAHYLGGAYYPVGGAEAIARAFAPVIEQAGGVLCHSAEVARVLVEGGRAVGVALEGGKEYRAPVVVSDAGVANTFGKLVAKEHVPPPLSRALATVPPSVGYLCLYLGLRETDAALGLRGTNEWFYPDHRHDENIARFVADPEAPLPLVYASYPSAKDPSFQERFPGRATIDLITLCPYAWVAKWEDTAWKKRGADYDAWKARITERMLDVLFRAHPTLRGKIDHAELSTPLTTRHFAGHPHGELYGIDHTPARYEVPLRAQTPVPGLFLTGADLVSCGVSAALVGGAITTGAILGLRTLGKIMAPPKRG
jgi:all-trans-retinol 13,14-reductase